MFASIQIYDEDDDGYGSASGNDHNKLHTTPHKIYQRFTNTQTHTHTTSMLMTFIYMI